MLEPTLEQIDEIRRTGFRPSVVTCCINDKRLLYMFKREYNIWLIPQGGINNKETPHQAISRELEEEMGKEFLNTCDPNYAVFGEDKIEFAEKNKGINQLDLDYGGSVPMIGKYYYFYMILVNNPKILVDQTEFDDYHWVNYKEGLFLAEKLYQQKKKQLMIKILEELNKINIVE